MKPTIIIPRLMPRPTIGYCRVCGHRFTEGTSDTVQAKHLQRCADEFMAKERERREPLSDLECRDPEYQAYAETAFRQGKLRPDTKRV
jgi:hypothetical protein